MLAVLIPNNFRKQNEIHLPYGKLHIEIIKSGDVSGGEVSMETQSPVFWAMPIKDDACFEGW